MKLSNPSYVKYGCGSRKFWGCFLTSDADAQTEMIRKG